MWKKTRDDDLTLIFEQSIDAFGEELANFFYKKVTPVFLLKQQGDMDEVKKIKSDIKPPFFTYRMGDLTLVDEAASNEKMMRWGALSGGPLSQVDDQGNPKDPNKDWVKLSPIQVDLNLNVEFVCSYSEQVRFSQMWMRLAVKRLLFILRYADFEIKCYITFDKTVTYSDIDFDTDATFISCQTTAVLRTWVVGESTIRPISTYVIKEKLLDPEPTDKTEKRTFAETIKTIPDGG